MINFTLHNEQRAVNQFKCFRLKYLSIFYITQMGFIGEQWIAFITLLLFNMQMLRARSQVVGADSTSGKSNGKCAGEVCQV